ncbi:5786_t:CDS:2, partial [Cetraspora pellucida]
LEKRPLDIDRTGVPKQILVGSFFGGWNQVRPMLEICKILVERGYNVTLVAPGDLLPSSEYPTIKQISTGPSIESDATYQELYHKTFNRNQMFSLRNLLVKKYLDYFETYQLAIKMIKPDLFFCNVFMINDICLDIAWSLKKPIVGFSSLMLVGTPFIPYKSEVWYNCHVNMENESFVNRFRCAIIEPIRSISEMWSSIDALNELRSTVGIRPVHNPFERMKNSLFLVNTFFGLEVPHPLPPLVQEIGPVMQDKYPLITPKLSSFISSHSQILYISFDPNTFIRPERNIILLHSILESIQKGLIDGAIWYSPSFSEEFISTKITLSDEKTVSISDLLLNKHPDLLFTKSNSQFSILNQTNVKLFLTTGDITTSYESLYTGTPMLILPVSFDQLSNSEKLVGLGVALTLPTYFSAAKVIKNIEEILNDVNIQKNLKKTKLLVRINSKRKHRAADLMEFVLHALTLNPSDNEEETNEMFENYEGLLKEWITPDARMGFFKGMYVDIYGTFIIVIFIALGLFLRSIWKRLKVVKYKNE